MKIVFLFWRTLYGPIGTEHAAVAGQRFQPSLTSLAFIEEEAGIDRHRFFLLKSTVRTGDPRPRARFALTQVQVHASLTPFKPSYPLRNRDCPATTRSRTGGATETMRARNDAPASKPFRLEIADGLRQLS